MVSGAACQKGEGSLIGDAGPQMNDHPLLPGRAYCDPFERSLAPRLDERANIRGMIVRSAVPNPQSYVAFPRAGRLVSVYGVKSAIMESREPSAWISRCHGEGRGMTADEPAQRGNGGGWRSWFFGLVVTAALIGAVLHFGDIQNFGKLLARAQPVWLGVAVLLQLSTYASVAMGWSLVLRQAGTPQPLRRLIRIAVTKLFADQAVPSAGMGGNVLLVDQLTALGTHRGPAVAALLVSMIGFYTAYVLLALIMLAMLWAHDKATPLMAAIVTVFMLVALAIPSVALWLRHRGRKPLPTWLDHIHIVRNLLDTVATAPHDLITDGRLLLKVAGCNALIFLADGATLWAAFHALGLPVAYGTAFIALMMASIVVTLGPIPLGLGTFEVTSTATLRLLGVPVEAAFAATMLLRILTLWLPLLPGMILMRSVLKRRSRRAVPKGMTI
jgi:uncharacterized membrane protein YbhN (UPF0104 family)